MIFLCSNYYLRPCYIWKHSSIAYRCSKRSSSTSPVITLLTRKTLQVINVRSRPHHHLEGWNGFIAGRTVTSVSKESAQIEKQNFIMTRNPTRHGFCNNFLLYFLLSRYYAIRPAKMCCHGIGVDRLLVEEKQ